MIQTLAQPVWFYAFFTAARAGKPGLTVTIDVYRGSTAVVTADLATEIGGGLYRYEMPGGSTGSAEAYAAIFQTADATVDAQHVPSLWVVGPAWAQAAARSGADQVWNEPLASHAVAGTAGATLSASAGSDGGDGDTPVDHNAGGPDNLRYVSGGAGIDDATVRAYLKAEFDAGVYAERGRTHTRSDGRWARPMYLNAGLIYTITFAKPGIFQVSTKEVTA